MFATIDGNSTSICKLAISVNSVGCLKFISKIQQLVCKLSQKNKYDVILPYISHPIYRLDF